MQSTPSLLRLASHSFRTAVRDATLLGLRPLSPSPNFEKIIGRRDAGSAFTAVLTTLSECPDGVDPVDTMVHGRVNSREAVGIILTAPLKSADRPRPETD